MQNYFSRLKSLCIGHVRDVYVLSHFSHVNLFATPRTVACQSSVHRSLQARILEWVVLPSSRGSSQPRDQTHMFYISCIAAEFSTTSSTWDASFQIRKLRLWRSYRCGWLLLNDIEERVAQVFIMVSTTFWKQKQERENNISEADEDK